MSTRTNFSTAFFSTALLLLVSSIPASAATTVMASARALVTASATPVPTVLPSSTPAPTAAPTKLPSSSPTATRTPVPAKTSTPTAAPTKTPAPTPIPTAAPTPGPTETAGACREEIPGADLKHIGDLIEELTRDEFERRNRALKALAILNVRNMAQYQRLLKEARDGGAGEGADFLRLLDLIAERVALRCRTTPRLPPPQLDLILQTELPWTRCPKALAPASVAATGQTSCAEGFDRLKTTLGKLEADQRAHCKDDWDTRVAFFPNPTLPGETAQTLCCQECGDSFRTVAFTAGYFQRLPTATETCRSQCEADGYPATACSVVVDWGNGMVIDEKVYEEIGYRQRPGLAARAFSCVVPWAFAQGKFADRCNLQYCRNALGDKLTRPKQKLAACGVLAYDRPLDAPGLASVPDGQMLCFAKNIPHGMQCACDVK